MVDCLSQTANGDMYKTYKHKKLLILLIKVHDNEESKNRKPPSTKKLLKFMQNRQKKLFGNTHSLPANKSHKS